MRFPIAIELRPRAAKSRGELCEEIVNLKLEVRLLHDALVQAEILNANQRDVIAHLEEVRQLARQQSERLDALREAAAAVRDGCIDWERGQMAAFTD